MGNTCSTRERYWKHTQNFRLETSREYWFILRLY